MRYEVIVSAEESDDNPALEVVRQCHAGASVRAVPVIVDRSGSWNGVVNRKVERLIAAARVARTATCC